MVEDMLKTVRTSRNGRRLLTSEQKAYIVDSWESSGDRLLNFAISMDSSPLHFTSGAQMQSEVQLWESDMKANFTPERSLRP